jgi:hypothetical protein
MAYEVKALHRIGPSGSPHYAILPDIYTNIGQTVQITKTEQGEGRIPRSVSELTKAGVIRRVRVRVKVAQNQYRQRFIWCANDAADSLGGIIGKNLPQNGNVEGGQITAVSLPRRRRLI